MRLSVWKSKSFKYGKKNVRIAPLNNSFVRDDNKKMNTNNNKNIINRCRIVNYSTMLFGMSLFYLII